MPGLEISNVVLQFADGKREKQEDLSGNSGYFGGTGSNAGKQIATVWVKAGPNFSGDGPGYGQRFELARGDRPSGQAAANPAGFEMRPGLQLQQS